MRRPKTPQGWLAVTASGAGGIVAIWGAVALALPIARSDDPPFAGIARVEGIEKHLVKKIDDLGSMLRQDIRDAANSVIVRDLQARLFSRRAEQCEAIRESNARLAATLGREIDEMRGELLMLTGLPHELRPCGEF